MDLISTNSIQEKILKRIKHVLYICSGYYFYGFPLKFIAKGLGAYNAAYETKYHDFRSALTKIEWQQRL